MCCPACLPCLGEPGRFFFFFRAKRKVPPSLPLPLLSLSLTTATTLNNLFFFFFLSSCDSLMVEMKSWKRSFGKIGFSRPRKYSLSTPATELMSCSFWSSTRGSSPGSGEKHLSGGARRGQDAIYPAHSPLSKEFLMSLTSMCDPGTRKMPCCCRPAREESEGGGGERSISEKTRFRFHTPLPPVGDARAHSRKCNLVIKGRCVFFQEGAPFGDAAPYGSS